MHFGSILTPVKNTIAILSLEAMPKGEWLTYEQICEQYRGKALQNHILTKSKCEWACTNREYEDCLRSGLERPKRAYFCVIRADADDMQRRLREVESNDDGQHSETPSEPTPQEDWEGAPLLLSNVVEHNQYTAQLDLNGRPLPASCAFPSRDVEYAAQNDLPATTPCQDSEDKTYLISTAWRWPQSDVTYAAWHEPHPSHFHYHSQRYQ